VPHLPLRPKHSRSRPGHISSQPAPDSQPRTTYPQTRDHGAPRLAAASQQTLQRQERSTAFFALNRRDGNVILHHRHIQPVLIRDWSPSMDGITATIWASQATGHPASWTPARPARTDHPILCE
jgi:hypothetical protein